MLLSPLVSICNDIFRDKRSGANSSARGEGWRKKERASNFDVRPPEGVILPPISGIPMTGESTFTYNGIMNRVSS